MNAAAFYRGETVFRALERASRCAGMPVSAHVPQGDRWVRVAGTGKCAACAYITTLRGGKDACDGSRGASARAAARSGMGRPFLCHVGFACLCMPAPGGAVLTFGPYCPAEQPESLDADFLDGLSALGEQPGSLPVSLRDVRVIPASAVPALAAWTVEALDALWADQRKSEEKEEAPTPIPETVPVKRAARRRMPGVGDAYGAGPIAAALAGHAHDKARALFRAAMSETAGHERTAQKTAIAVKRARAIAAAAAVLEAAARASLPVDACWDHFGELLDEARQARNELQLANAAMRLLGRIKPDRAHKTQAAPPRNSLQASSSGVEGAVAQAYAELNKIVLAHLEEGITLNEVARQLGQQPTAITHRLQRNFGMSYSDYVGRLRVDRAKELLRRTRLTVDAIGKRVGIDDASNFRKLFRKFETLAPQEYRARFGGRK